MLSFVVAATALQVAQPPFKKIYTRVGGGNFSDDSYAVQGDWIYAANGPEYTKLNGRTGKPVWRQSLPKTVRETAFILLGNRVFVIYGTEGPGTFMEISPSTGKPLWKIPRYGYPNHIAASGRLVLQEGSYGTISAVDVGKRRVVWKRDIVGKEAKGGLTGLRIVGDRALVGTFGGTLVGLELATGKPVWGREFPGDYQPLKDVSGGVVIAGGSKAALQGLRTTNGAPVWKRTDITKSTGVRIVGEMAFVTNGNRLEGISLLAGSPLWALDLPTPIGSLRSTSVVRDGVLYTRSYNALFAIDTKGKQRWTWPLDDDNGGVLAVYPSGFVLGGDYVFGTHSTGGALYGFVMGAVPGLPTASANREALARKLIARYVQIQRDEESRTKKLGQAGLQSGKTMEAKRNYREETVEVTRTLEKLGHDALGPLLERYVIAAKADAAQGEKPGPSYYGELDEFSRLIFTLSTSADTESLLKAFHAVPRDSFGGFRLLSVIVEKGDPKLATPTYLEVLKKQKLSASSSWTEAEAALGGVMNSPEPAAVAFMIAQLRDPKADPSLRQAAYVSVARYGGAEARQAVLELRTKSRTLPPLAELMKLDKLPAQPSKERERTGSSRLLAVSGDDGLVSCGIYGGNSDLFVVKRKNGKWTDPVFTGAGRASTRGKRGKYKEADAEYEALLKNWVKSFVGNPKLAVDTDGDGLTDLAEARLGTDKAKADTDGDGLQDAIDQNPLVAARALTDDEAMLAAAFEARYRFTERHITPSIVTYPGNPFELLGQDGYVLPEKSAGKAKDMFGLGAAYVRLNVGGPEKRDEGPGGPPQPERPVPEGARQVSVGTTYAGLNGTGFIMSLRKIDGAWFVVESYMEWIS